MVQSGVTFQDFGWQTPSYDAMHERSYDPDTDMPPRGFDHTCVWYVPGKPRNCWLVTTEPYEPYLDEVVAECRRLDWAHRVLERGIGLWNAPHTRIILAMPMSDLDPTGAASWLDVQGSRLETMMPRWDI